jgi:hypothetical protein
VKFLHPLIFLLYLGGCGGDSDSEKPFFPQIKTMFMEDNASHYPTKRIQTDLIIEEVSTVPDSHSKVKSGVVFDWYENGQKKSQVTYSLGMKNGLSLKWYSDGQLKEESSFVNDKLHGLYSMWKQRGKRKMVGSYSKGKQDGEWIFYDEMGEAMPSIYYRDGIEVTRDLHGLSR